jgi:hypothetical protein
MTTTLNLTATTTSWSHRNASDDRCSPRSKRKGRSRIPRLPVRRTPPPPPPRRESKGRPAQRNEHDCSATKKGPTRPAAKGMSQATDTAREKNWTGNQQRRAAQHVTPPGCDSDAAMNRLWPATSHTQRGPVPCRPAQGGPSTHKRTAASRAHAPCLDDPAREGGGQIALMMNRGTAGAS